MNPASSETDPTAYWTPRSRLDQAEPGLGDVELVLIYPDGVERRIYAADITIGDLEDCVMAIGAKHCQDLSDVVAAAYWSVVAEATSFELDLMLDEMHPGLLARLGSAPILSACGPAGRDEAIQRGYTIGQIAVCEGHDPADVPPREPGGRRWAGQW